MRALCHLHTTISTCHTGECVLLAWVVFAYNCAQTLFKAFAEQPRKESTSRGAAKEPISVMYPLCIIHIRKQACAQRMPVQEKEPRLPMLLKLLLWAQSQLDSKLQYPRMVDLVAGRLSDPTDVNQMC